MIAVVVKLSENEELLLSEVLDVMVTPLVERDSDGVLCELVEVEPQGQIHLGAVSLILEEAKKNTECNLRLSVKSSNFLKQFL